MAAGQVEAAARAAGFKAEAAAELRAVNDRLLAQVAAAERLAEIEREHAKQAAQWRSAAQDDVLTKPDDRAQQAQWLAAQTREMQLTNVQMQAQIQAQMQAYMQDQIERLAEQQARRDEERRKERLWEEERLKERLQLDALYRSAIDGCTRQPSGPTATAAYRSVKDEPGQLLTPGGDGRTPSNGRRSDSQGGRSHSVGLAEAERETAAMGAAATGAETPPSPRNAIVGPTQTSHPLETRACKARDKRS